MRYTNRRILCFILLYYMIRSRTLPFPSAYAVKLTDRVHRLMAVTNDPAEPVSRYLPGYKIHGKNAWNPLFGIFGVVKIGSLKSSHRTPY